MCPLVVIRHGPTDWNRAGRIQGRSDPPLSDQGRGAVRRWRLPPELTGAAAADWDWLTSPLARARETAALLGSGLGPGAGPAVIRPEPALIEMSWGAWEGRRLDELRAEGGDAMAEAEAFGLDFCPPGGESPRQVQGRLGPLLETLAAAGRPVVAISHKGVLRALYALASGWNMTDAPAENLRDACAHRFLLVGGGAVRLDRMNLPLSP
ncbi:MAG: histidine phosphatase family protein [Kiloniellales bacterium]